MAHQPLILPDLRLALACVYNLPLPESPPKQVSMHQAQEVLIHVQSRNVRRKIWSLLQRQRSKQEQQHQQTRLENEIPIERGSSWFACLALLCHMPTASDRHPIASSERLFAAQTLVHRLRRTTLAQAIDLEVEVSAEDKNDASLLHFLEELNPTQIVHSYQQWMQLVNPFIASLLSDYQPAYPDEDRVKGELSLITVMAAAYLAASMPQKDSNTGPLINTLSSAAAALALRLRFTVESIEKTGGAAPHTEPILIMVTQALYMVFNAANSNSQQLLNVEACGVCLRACLGAIPDVLFGNTGGSRGRMSVDPRCIQMAMSELRSNGVPILSEILQKHHDQHLHILQQQQANQQVTATTTSTPNEESSHEHILVVCERWAKFLPLPADFIQQTLPLANRYIAVSDFSSGARRAALSFLVAIYEGAIWTVDQVLSSYVGLTDKEGDQAKKKRQSSKSKKRHKELLNSHTTDTLLAQAHAEVLHRAETACTTTLMVWESLSLALEMELARISQAQHAQIEGEGPIGCLSACANACLPHLLRHPSPHSTELFIAVSKAFQTVCSSPNRQARLFCLEPIFTLHSAMINYVQEKGALDNALQDAILDHFFQCGMSLASSCSYPVDYFDDLGASSDEELEMERNDIRDIIRTVTVSDVGGSTAGATTDRLPFDATLMLLKRVLTSCTEAINEARDSNKLFPETAVHCFSALAKPLNQLAKCFSRTGQPEGAAEILMISMHTLGTILHMVLEAFPTAPVVEIFPRSRICSIAIASLSPMISALCWDEKLHENHSEVLRLSVRSAAVSVAHLPEIAKEAELGASMYGIRGAMRGPGGEDHVGCLAIMRLANESDKLARAVVEAAATDIQGLCELHSKLKAIEARRGQQNRHGEGVTPKSRRILLGVICHLEITSGGKAGCSAMIKDLFHSSISAIASSSPPSFEDENFLFHLCENTFDLASFSSIILGSLFSDVEDDQVAIRNECLKTLTNACVAGYQRIGPHEPSNVEIQWNRFRASLFSLLLASGNPDLPKVASEIAATYIRAECEAIQSQCQAGPSSASSIFNDDVISDDFIPAGLFVRVVGDVVERAHKQGQKDIASVQNCVSALVDCRMFVLAAIAQPCPEPLSGSFVDPRPTIGEAWFWTMNQLLQIVGQNPNSGNQHLLSLLVDSCVVAISLLFYPTIGKTRDQRINGPGMCLDGAQSLALSEMLGKCFNLGPQFLWQVARELKGRISTLYTGDQTLGDEFQGVAIISAALFRAAQGALPPWFVESVPTIYAGLFVALDRDAKAFTEAMRMGIDIRLHQTGNEFGAVKPGQLLSGPLFESVAGAAKATFLEHVMEVCSSNNFGGWKRLKVFVKQFCGGKKKDTDFKQKPSTTRWDFERV